MRTRQIRRLAAALAVSAAAFPAAAHADAITYLKGGQVWVAHADGSGARQFTVHQYGWAWPSMADNGAVVVAGGLERVDPSGTDTDGSSELYRFQGDGNQIGTFTPTYGSYSTPSCPTFPPRSVRVSPDGTKIVYSIYGCGGGGYETSLWTPAGSTGLNFPGQSIGQQDHWDPVWINNSRFTVSHVGPPLFGDHWGEHLVTDGDNVGAGWYESAMDNRSARAVISRDGKEAVVFFEDSASFTDGKPRNVDMWVYSNPSMPAAFNADFPSPAAGCRFTLDASKLADIQDLSPTLSPDGTKVLYATSDGAVVRALGDVTSGCAGASAPVLLVPGAAQPFYSGGNVQAGAAAPHQPDPTAPTAATGGGGGGGGGGGTPPATTTPPPTSTGAVIIHLLARFSFKPKTIHAHKKVTFDARKSTETGGKVVAYRWKFGDGKTGKGRKVKHAYKKRGRYTVTLTVRDASGHKATAKRKVKVR
jgi:hypothetical protein